MIKKINSYPKYSYIIFLIISLILLILSTCPLFLWTDTKLIIKLLWSSIMIIFSLISFLCFLYFKQILIITKNSLILRNIFGQINEISFDKYYYEIRELPTFFSWSVSIKKKWICIYEDSSIPKFTYGCSNSKKYNRIQVILNKKNEVLIKSIFD